MNDKIGCPIFFSGFIKLNTSKNDCWLYNKQNTHIKVSPQQEKKSMYLQSDLVNIVLIAACKVKINCPKFIIDELKQRYHMTWL